MNAIELINISKSYLKGLKKKNILNNINLTIKQGEFVVLQGENGAGKTTLLNIILGLQKPDDGTVKLFNYSPQEPESKISVGSMLQKAKAPDSLKVKELINLIRSYYSEPLSTEELLCRVGLEKKPDDWAAKLSGGQEQLLYFALALAGNPELLILDEPTRNLDVNANSNFWEQVRSFANQGKTILVVTHNQADQEKIADLAPRILKLSNGRLEESNTTKYDEMKAHQEKTDFSELKYGNVFKMLLEQTRSEFLHLWRTPTFLLGILVISSLVAAFPKDDPNVVMLLVGLGGINLILVAIEKFGIRVATERVQGWAKLLRVTPLHPWIYLTAKVIVSLVVSMLSLGLMLGLGAWKIGIAQSLSSWLVLFFSLVLGVLPFAILGLAIGYLVEPKSVSSITALVLPLAIFTSGLPLPGMPKFVQDLVSCSPFYHYGQLALWAAGIDNYDNYLGLHLEWLLWTASASGLLAVWAYQRDQVTQ